MRNTPGWVGVARYPSSVPCALAYLEGYSQLIL